MPVPEAGVWTVRRQTTPAPGGLVDKGTKGKRARQVPITEEIRTPACSPVLAEVVSPPPYCATQRYLHPDVRQITAAGAALTAHLSVLRAPRSLPNPIVVAR
ncbi:hypothetical protein OG762_40670 [Streptomyces sp. NBC_01136]|nr:hypothetical protein OG762_40670 [Streptomyces sp. NBC_01136]